MATLTSVICDDSEEDQFIKTYHSRYCKSLSDSIEPDADNDMYPLSSGFNPLTKVYGLERLHYAVWYFEPTRIRELVFEYLKNNPDELYKPLFASGNPFNHLCGTSYNARHCLYKCKTAKEQDSLFFFYLHVYPSLERAASPNCYKRTPLGQCLYQGNFHYMFALLNFGFKFAEEEYEKMDFGYCSDKKIKSQITTFLKSDLYHRIIDSKKPNGFKLLDMDGGATPLICPITLEKIKNPVMLSDCKIYEYNVVAEWFRENGPCSPLNRERLNCPPYLIFENKFIHF